MTSITWIEKESGKTDIQIFRSKDKLEQMLQNVKFNRELNEHYIEVKQGKKKIIKVIRGVSYESTPERALFSSYKIIPKKKDYPYNTEDDSDDQKRK